MNRIIQWIIIVYAVLFVLCGCKSFNKDNPFLLNKHDDEYDLSKQPKRLKLLDFDGDERKKTSSTALMQAVIEDQMDIVKLLLEKGADIDAKDEDNWTALTWAIHYDRLDIAEFLIEKGADVNINTKNGQSPLSMAIHNNYNELSKKLLAKGAEVNIKTQNSQSMLSLAIKRKHKELAQLMLESKICLKGSPRSSCFPLVIALRGDSANFPENTIEAFDGALKAKADMIELDVFPTKDNDVIICHDANLDRTTDGNGKIWDYSLEELKALDAGSWFDPRFKGAKLPSLEEVFKTFGNKIIIFVELKNDIPHERRSALIRKLLKLISKYNLYTSVIVSSDNYQILRDLRENNKKVLLGVISYGKDSNINVVELAKAVNACMYCPVWKDVDEELVKKLHKAGIMLAPWAAKEDNTRKTMDKMLKIGVEGFFANDPAILKKCVDQYRSDSEK